MYNWDFVVAVVVRGGGGYDSVFVAAYRDAVGGGSDVDNDDLIELSLRWIFYTFHLDILKKEFRFFPVKLFSFLLHRFFLNFSLNKSFNAVDRFRCGFHSGHYGQINLVKIE